MGFFNGKGRGKLTPGASSSHGSPALSLPPPRRGSPPERQRLYIPVHQARWHWQYRQPMPYPDVNLPHGWHMDPQHIPIPVAPRCAQAHAEEVLRQPELLTPEQRAMRAYAPDSHNWEC